MRFFASLEILSLNGNFVDPAFMIAFITTSYEALFLL